MLVTLLVFFLVLSILVLIHELGHFLVAKKLNIKVEEFGFGFPPRVWGIRRGETLYSINLLPIGGFVKLFGEDDAGGGKVSLPANTKQQTAKGRTHTSKNKLPNMDLKRAFFARSVGQRAAVVLAGVIMNVLLAVIIFYLYLFVSGFKAELPLIGSHTFFGVTQTTKSDVFINGVAKNSPAEKAGIPAFALLKTVNGKEIKTVSEFTSVIKKDAGTEVTLRMVDSQTKKIITRKVTPRKDPPKGQGALGVSLFAADTAVLAYDTPVQKIFSGFIHPANLMVYNLDIFAKLARVAIEKKDAAPLSEGVAGPVGIYSVVGTIVQIPDIKERSLQLLNLAGLLSISLAFFNVLPIPALDGGRLFFIVIEAITRRKVNAKFETVVHSIGMAVLLLLIVLVTFKDVFQFIL